MVEASDVELLFQHIKSNNPSAVRDLLSSHQPLTTSTLRLPHYTLPPTHELEAYKFLGAYFGSLTPLQYAILLGHDGIARDILDVTFREDLNVTFGGGNNALHLATFLGAREVVAALLERGADSSLRNSKGFTPLDIVDDDDMRKLFGGS